MNKKKKIVFISSCQNELHNERHRLRDLINTADEILPKIFKAYTFELDLSGRKESVLNVTDDWVLKSDVYLGIFDREYSEPTIHEYELAVEDKFVRKEIIIFIRERTPAERQDMLNRFLDKIMGPSTGHSCVIYKDLNDLLEKAKRVLLAYFGRITESFILWKETLGPKLEGARGTNMPESLRRQLLEPMGVYEIHRGRKGFPEYYKFDINGDKVDITWEFIVHEPQASKEIIEFYHERYKKPYDSF